MGGPAAVRLLLDTHIWLWSFLEPGKLSRRVRDALEDAGNQLWLSPISVWELVVLVEKRRVALDRPVARWVDAAMNASPLTEASLTYDVAVESGRVRLPHQDPADRLLAATARVFDLTLVTADEPLIRARGVPTLANR